MSNQDYSRNGSRLVEEYAALEWKLLELHRKTKKPIKPAWPATKGLSVESAKRLVEHGGSIGVQAGEASRWLCCVDNDTPEAVKLASYFLLKTLPMGKQGIASNYLYYSPYLDYVKYSDLDGGEILCVKAAARGQGHQFVVPPSVHPEKGPYEWVGGFDPDRILEVPRDELERSVQLLATSALIAAHLPEKGRHDYSLALAGYLLNNGVEKSVVVRLCHAAWQAKGAPAEHISDLLRNIDDTEEKVRLGEPFKGGPTLNDIVDGLPKKLAKFLKFDSLSTSRQAPPQHNGHARVGTTHHRQPFRLTDLGNAERLVSRHGDDIRYCHAYKKWFVWDGRRWKIDDSGKIARLAVDTVASIYGEAQNAPDGSQQRKEIARHAMASEAKGRIDAMVALTQSRPGIPVSPADLDQDRWLLNAPNGTIDLRTGEVLEHRRSDLITKLVGAPYDPDAKANRFKRFLTEIFEDDEDLIRFVQRFSGYSATGSTRERAIAILHGRGKNGKTTLIELLQEALGDYSKTTETETLLAQRQRSISNDVAALKGARFVSAAEVERGRSLSESKVKQLTGNDTITARFLFGEFFDFKPEFSLWLSTNNKPVIRGTDDAIWDRIKLVPFNKRFTGDQDDTSLPETLRSELPGVLSWIVAGCLAWQEVGLKDPKTVSKATHSYRTEMDVLAAFIDEDCVTGENVWCKFKDLYDAYSRWCESSNEYPEKKRAFADSLTERGYKPGRGPKNIAIREGIALRHDGGPDGGDDGGRVNDDPPENDQNGADSDLKGEKMVNRGGVGVNVVNPQKTSKSAHFDRGLTRVNQNIDRLPSGASRKKEPRKSLTVVNSLTHEHESAPLAGGRQHVTSASEDDGETTVVNFRREPYDVYIGRVLPGLGLEQSDWHNPFKTGVDGTREEVIEKFERYLTQEREDLMARLPELRGKTLGCWCKPKPCHGDVLARLADSHPRKLVPDE